MQQLLTAAPDLDADDARELARLGEQQRAENEQIEALRRIAGATAVALIERRPDEAIVKIVSGWPERFEARRAGDLGFVAETSFDEIIRAHIADELGGKIGAA